MALSSEDRQLLEQMAARSDDPAVTEALAKAARSERAAKIASIMAGIRERTGLH